MSDSELSSIPNSDNESRRGSQSQSRSRSGVRPAAAITTKPRGQGASGQNSRQGSAAQSPRGSSARQSPRGSGGGRIGSRTPSADSRPVTPPSRSQSRSRSGVARSPVSPRDDSKLLSAKEEQGGVEMVPLNDRREEEEKDFDIPPHDDNVRTALGERPREEQREREAAAAAVEGAGSRRRMAVRTNLKDGYYVDSRTSYFWIKYEMPLWIGLSVLLCLFFVISLIVVLDY